MTGAHQGSRTRSTAGARALAAGLACAALLGASGCTGAATPTGTGVIAAPPTPGSVTQTVPAGPSQAPITVKLDQEANLSGIVVSVAAVRSQQIDSNIPSDGTGPGLVFTVKVRNSSTRDYVSDLLQATLLDSKGNASSPILGTPATRFPATIAAGADASADLAFLVPANTRTPVSLTVSVGAGTQPATFTGNAPS